MKMYSSFVLLTLSFSPLFSQPKANFTVSLNHVALSVQDIDKASQFYGEILNLTEITNRTEMPGIRWFSIGDGKELHLISTIKEPVTINKAVHLAFTTSDFEAFINHLQARKINYSDWPGKPYTISVRADGIRQVFFQDLDGYWIEMNSVGQN